LLAALWFACPSSPARAWGTQGHRIACEIAYRRLSDEGRALVYRLRQGDRDATFAESCMWADRVREATGTGAYHYVNIPPAADGFDMDRDCPAPRRCVTWAVVHYAGILQDAERPRSERAEALKYLGHFVVDLHQPLHVGLLSDRGGNRTRVVFDGKADVNLHSLWDTGVLERAGLIWPRAAVELDGMITAAQATAWSETDVREWTRESRALVKEVVYRTPTGGEVVSGSELDERYLERALVVSQQRLQTAGIRLAHLINTAGRAEETQGMVKSSANRSMPYHRLPSRRFSSGACWLLSWLAIGTMTIGRSRTCSKR
jgi:hypothetical protein